MAAQELNDITTIKIDKLGNTVLDPQSQWEQLQEIEQKIKELTKEREELRDNLQQMPQKQLAIGSLSSSWIEEQPVIIGALVSLTVANIALIPFYYDRCKKKAKEDDEKVNGDDNRWQNINNEQTVPFIESVPDTPRSITMNYFDIIIPSQDDGKYSKYKKYISEYISDYIQLFVGVIYLFFGAQFVLTIACDTAIQITGWETITSSWKIIKQNYNDGMNAFETNPNVKQLFGKNNGRISLKEIINAIMVLFSGTSERKKDVLANLKCIYIAVDPRQIMIALSGLWAIIVVVIATLRSKFAKDIALGVSLGSMFSIQISKYSKRSKDIDQNLQKWTDFGINIICRILGISLALILVRVVSAFYSAIKGGEIFALFVFNFLSNKQILKQIIGDNDKQQNVQIRSLPLFVCVQYGLAITGFWWQLSSGFTLNSLILRVVLLPFSICEYILTWLAGY